jgi:hypothetical protein
VRRLIPLGTLSVLIALLALVPAACKRKTSSATAPAESSAQLLSVVNMSDPAAAAQLAHGFYGLEASTWRWTMQKFSVALKPPPGAAQNGARLTFSFSVPGVVVGRLGPIQLSATINGLALAPETYAQPGKYTYARDVPASALSGDAVTVDFACDKVLPPTGDDSRELALIAVSVGLESK